MAPDTRPGIIPQSEALMLRPNEAVLSYAQVGTLVGLNLNTKNLNKSNYEITFGTNGEKFNAGSFDPVNVVWVQTSPQTKTLFILDGNHRTSVVFKHWDKISERFPLFRFALRNVTSDYLPRKEGGEPRPERRFREVLAEAPDLVLHTSADEYPSALSMAEYLRFLVPPTQVQKDILPIRVALTLMQGWRSFVGSDELDKKFPASAAFSILAHSNVQLAESDEIAKFIGEQRRFFPGDTEEEREKLRKALHAMSGVMHDYHVLPNQVLDSAFVIIGTKDDFLDVPDQVKRQQALGLVNLPSVHDKFAAYGETLAEEYKSRASIALQHGLPRDRSSAETMGRVIHDVLVDPRLTGTEVINILNHPGNIGRKRESLLIEYQVRQLTDQYKAITGITKLPDLEHGLIERFCGTDDISKYQQTEIIKDIQQAQADISRAEQLLKQLLDSTSPMDQQRKEAYITDLIKTLRAVHSRRKGNLSKSLFHLRFLGDTIPYYLERSAMESGISDHGGVEESRQTSRETPLLPGATTATNRVDTDAAVIFYADKLGQVLSRPGQLGSDAQRAVTQLTKIMQGYIPSDDREAQGRRVGGFSSDSKEAAQNGLPPAPEGFEWAVRDGKRGLVRRPPAHTARTLKVLATARTNQLRDKVTIPEYVKRYPEEIFSGWEAHASCRGKEDIVNVEGAAENEAKKLCVSCPVKHACLANDLVRAIKNGEVQFVRGGETARSRRHMLYKERPAVDELIGGVESARAYQAKILFRANV